MVSLREQGWRPAVVAVHVSDAPPFEGGEVLEIVVRADEPFERMDWRCLVGLDVIVTAERGQQRSLRAMCMAAVDAGAKRVMGVEYDHLGQGQNLFTHGVH